MICNTENDQKKEIEYIKYCEGIRIKGIILTEGHSTELFKNNPHANVVFHDRSVDGNFSYVKSNNSNGIQMLVDYLYNLQHTNIAFAGYDSSIKSVKERKEAFDYFCSLSDRPTAVVCANDMIAKGFIHRANALGVSIPNDFSVTGFDGCSTDYFFPKITTIRQNIKLIAQKLFECAISDKDETIQYEADVTLLVGNSCKKMNLL